MKDKFEEKKEKKSELGIVMNCVGKSESKP